ncbi:unnamed protein product [Urochloa humidicola]
MSRQPSETARSRAGAEAEQQQQEPPPPALEMKLEALPQLVQGLASDDSSLQLEAIKELRELLSIERNPPIQEVIDSGAVPFFVEFLSREDRPQIQFEAAKALTYILKGTSSENTKVVVDQGAVPIFVELLSSPSEDIRQEAVWALGDMACTSLVFRDILLAHGVLLPLLRLLKGNLSLSLLRSSTWALSIICQGGPQINFDLVKLALQVLRQLIHSQDESVIIAACWALSFMSDGFDSDRIQALVDVGVCPRLVELLTHSSHSVHFPALRAVSRIANGDDAQIQCIIDHQALPCFLDILMKDEDKMKKGMVCWIIAQFTNTNKEQIQAVIDGNIIGPLVHLMQTAELDVKREAAVAVGNAAAVGTPDQTKYLVSKGCIKAFCDLLDCSDTGILEACLDGLKGILIAGKNMKSSGASDENIYVRMIEDAGGLFGIEDLQKHDDDTIHEMVVDLLVTFWPEMFEAPKRLMPDEVDEAQTSTGNSDGEVVDPLPGGSNLG